MIEYKLFSTLLSKEPTMVQKIDGDFSLSIPFDPANNDYDKFKKEIAEDKAQLQDVNGNVMSAEEAKAYIATLP